MSTKRPTYAEVVTRGLSPDKDKVEEVRLTKRKAATDAPAREYFLKCSCEVSYSFYYTLHHRLGRTEEEDPS